MKNSLRQAAMPPRRSLSRGNSRQRPESPASGQHPRRRFLRLASGAAVLPAVSRIAGAQSYPTRPITMIVPVAAGGQVDAIARVLAEQMRKTLGQPVIIENVSGADGTLGTGRVARAVPDGYTIDLGTASTNGLNGAFYSLRYSVLNDFAPITPLATIAYVMYGRKTLPVTSLHELIDWLTNNPNKASIGIAGVSHRLLTAVFKKETGTQFGAVPYRGAAPAVPDLLAGQIDLVWAPPDWLPLVRAGRIKAYAVTSETRLARAPDIPTFAEMRLPAVSFPGWYGLFAPKGTPKEIIDRLNAASVQAFADPAVRSRLVDLGMEIFPRAQQTPQALGAMVKNDAEKWWPII
jgi:tripartite-type tricarboxylate transporter receptor subunit TctC